MNPFHAWMRKEAGVGDLARAARAASPSSEDWDHRTTYTDPEGFAWTDKEAFDEYMKARETALTPVFSEMLEDWRKRAAELNLPPDIEKMEAMNTVDRMRYMSPVPPGWRERKYVNMVAEALGLHNDDYEALRKRDMALAYALIPDAGGEAAADEVFKQYGYSSADEYGSHKLKVRAARDAMEDDWRAKWDEQRERLKDIANDVLARRGLPTVVSAGNLSEAGPESGSPPGGLADWRVMTHGDTPARDWWTTPGGGGAVRGSNYQRAERGYLAEKLRDRRPGTVEYRKAQLEAMRDLLAQRNRHHWEATAQGRRGEAMPPGWRYVRQKSEPEKTPGRDVYALSSPPAGPHARVQARQAADVAPKGDASNRPASEGLADQAMRGWMTAEQASDWRRRAPKPSGGSIADQALEAWSGAGNGSKEMAGLETETP